MANFGSMHIRSTGCYVFTKIYSSVIFFPQCKACNFPTETTNHNFYECPAVKSFWNDAFNWWNLKHSENKLPWALRKFFTQCEKVVSDSPGLLDFAIGLVNSVLNLPDGQSEVFWGIQLTEELWNQFCSSKNFGALVYVEMTLGLVNASFC